MSASRLLKNRRLDHGINELLNSLENGSGLPGSARGAGTLARRVPTLRDAWLFILRCAPAAHDCLSWISLTMDPRQWSRLLRIAASRKRTGDKDRRCYRRRDESQRDMRLPALFLPA